MLLQCLDECKHIWEERLKSDNNKEVKANTWGNFCSGKGGQIGLFSQPYTSSPQWGLCFWRCTSLWSLFLNPQGHGLLPPSLPWPGWSCFPGQDQLLACSCGSPPPNPPLLTCTHKPHTTHLPPAPLPSPASHSGHPSNVLCKYDMWQCSLSPSFLLCLIASWPLLLPMAS